MPVIGTLCSVNTSVDFQWIIPDYANICSTPRGAYIRSPIFTALWHGNKKIEWQLFLYPNGDMSQESKKHASLFLDLVSGAPVHVNFQLSTLDEKRNHRNVKKMQYYYKKCVGWGKPTFFPVEDIDNRRSELLTGGSLIISCAIRHIPAGESPGPVVSSTLSSDLDRLLDLKCHTNVTFDVDGHVFHLHKSIISARCPALAALFHDDDQTGSGSVKITNMKEKVFASMIRYIYTDQTDNIDDVADYLLVAADQYELQPLKASCEEVLIGRICRHTAIRILLFADLYSATRLKSCAIDFFVNNIRHFVDDDTQFQLLTDSLRWEIFKKLAAFVA